MKRYQLYLNPQSVSVIDEATGYIDISRSAIIRMVVDNLAENLTKLFAKKEKPKEYPCLDSLIGTIKIKGKKQVNYSQRDDSLYYKD